MSMDGIMGQLYYDLERRNNDFNPRVYESEEEDNQITVFIDTDGLEDNGYWLREVISVGESMGLECIDSECHEMIVVKFKANL